MYLIISRNRVSKDNTTKCEADCTADLFARGTSTRSLMTRSLHMNVLYIRHKKKMPNITRLLIFPLPVTEHITRYLMYYKINAKYSTILKLIINKQFMYISFSIFRYLIDLTIRVSSRVFDKQIIF